MYRNTRYDAQDYSALGLGAGRLPTVGYPITASTETLMRAGAPWYAVGAHVTSQTFSAAFLSWTLAEVAAELDRMVATGVNALGLFGLEAFGLGQSGPYTDRPVGMFVGGKQWRTNLPYTQGQYCHTLDGSKVERVYIKTNVGTHSTAGSGSGPSGTGTGIADGSCTWNYVMPMYSQYNEQWFSGDGTTAGLDRIMDECAQRGIYVMLRMDKWDKVFMGRTGLPFSNSGNLVNAFGVETIFTSADSALYSIPDYRAFEKTHLATFLNRVNTVNGRRYGDDPTFMGINLFNERGAAYWFFNTTSTSSPSGNTWDYMVFRQWSGAGGVNDYSTALVAALDAKWLAWHTATFGSAPVWHSTVNPAVTYQTFPCCGFVTADTPATPTTAVNGIMPRGTFRANYAAAPVSNEEEPYYTERLRAVRFLSEAEASGALELRDYVLGLAPGCLIDVGQFPWVFPETMQVGHVGDIHDYGDAQGSPVTNSNTESVSGTLAWAAGTATITLGSAPSSHPLKIGQHVRASQTGGAWTAVLEVATLSSTTVFTAATADPGFTGACSVVCPTENFNFWSLHNEPPATNVAGSTRFHINLVSGGGVETDLDVASWKGDSAFSKLLTTGFQRLANQPRIATEVGARGLNDLSRGHYPLFHAFLDLLGGGSGGFRQCIINGELAPTDGEHAYFGHGATYLMNAAITMLARVMPAHPVTDTTRVQPSDIYAWYTHKTTMGANVGGTGLGGGYADNAPNWRHLVDISVGGFGPLNGASSQFRACLSAKCRVEIGATTAKSATNYNSDAVDSGHIYGGLSDPASAAGRLWLNCNVGYLTYENPKLCYIVGRIPAATVDGTDLTRMNVSTSDGKLWYGFVLWVSLDGTDLGVGRSCLFTWTAVRDESARTRRHFMEASGTTVGPGAATTSARTSRIEYLDGDYFPAAGAAKQPGVVMRNGLRVKLTMAGAKAATVPERYGAMRTHGAHYKSGALWINPSRPLIVLG